MNNFQAGETALWARFANLKLKDILKKPNFKRAMWGFAIAFTSFGVFAEHVHFIKSYTDSLPEHYFVQLTKMTPKKGDLTIVYNGWYKGRIIKKIIGEAGDQITSDVHGNVWINDLKVGRAHQRTEFTNQASNTDSNQRGLTLTTIKSQVIPEGRVFLYAPHPKSFDSRYEEVGLVKLSDLEGKVIAII